MLFVAQIPNSMFDPGTTLENQMQQSVSTLTVSTNVDAEIYRDKWLGNLWERKVCKVEIYVRWGRNMGSKKRGKKDQTGKSKRSKLETKSILSQSFKIWRYHFSFSYIFLVQFAEISLWVPLKVQIGALQGRRWLIKCFKSPSFTKSHTIFRKWGTQIYIFTLDR